MGAEFNTLRYDGSFSKHEVMLKFNDAQEEDRYYNGHSYSGGVGMASGLTFTNKLFDSEVAADDWLSEHAEKWEDALAVTYKDPEGKIFWLIGAWCSS